MDRDCNVVLVDILPSNCRVNEIEREGGPEIVRKTERKREGGRKREKEGEKERRCERKRDCGTERA